MAARLLEISTYEEIILHKGIWAQASDGIISMYRY